MRARELCLLIAIPVAAGCGAKPTPTAPHDGETVDAGSAPEPSASSDAGLAPLPEASAPLGHDGGPMNDATTGPGNGPTGGPGNGPTGGPEPDPTWTGTEAGLAAVQADGKLLIVFHEATGAGDTYTLQRRSSSTAIDTTFGAKGSIVLSGTPVQVGVAPSGTILVLSAVGSQDQIQISAFDLTGAPVAGFEATAGLASLEVTSPGLPWAGDVFDGEYFPKTSAMAIQDDGQILVAGLVVPGGISNGLDVDGVVTRLTADGSVDTSFGAGGRVVVTEATSTDIALLEGGDFVLVTESTATDSFALTWYGPSGSPLAGVAPVPVAESGYGGVLARSDGSVLVGTYMASGTQVWFQGYSANGLLEPTPGPFVTPGLNHHFIAPGDVLTAVPISGPQVTEQRTLPNGTAESTLNGTVPVDAGTLTFENAVPLPDGGTLLLGDTCIGGPTSTLACTAVVTILSATGSLQ